MFPEWRFSLNRGVSKKRCHCILNKFTSRFRPPLFSKYTALQAVLTFLSLQKNWFFYFSSKETRIVQAKTNASGFCVTVRGRPSWELWAAPLSAHAYLAACSLSTCELVSTCAVDVAKNSVLFVWSRRKVPLGRVAGTTKHAPWHQCRPRSLERIINVNNLRCSVSGHKAENHLLYITWCEL